jgi:hypothetical protein
MVGRRWITVGVLAAVCVVGLASVGVASGFSPKKGDIAVTYSGSASGSYTYSVPQFDGSGGGCEFAAMHGTVTDRWNWTAKYWFSQYAGNLHHKITTSGSSNTDQVVSPCTANGSTNPGSTLVCRAPYVTDTDGSNPPFGNLQTAGHGYQLALAMAVTVGDYSPSSCNGLTDENPYSLNEMLNPPQVSIKASALKRGFQKSAGHSVHHSCNSVICGYQQCVNEPGSSQPGAGAVSCSAEESWKAEIKVSRVK